MNKKEQKTEFGALASLSSPALASLLHGDCQIEAGAGAGYSQGSR